MCAYVCVCPSLVQNRLSHAKEKDGAPMPAYFRFLTLLGLRLFLQAVRGWLV